MNELDESKKRVLQEIIAQLHGEHITRRQREV
ncbi:MAG: hypothetical protein QG670_2204 [Thermoproteota archaeon]|nr:hypothetical protein [Thermoproteota archaeon]